jgi:hypothetical protein
VIVPAPIIGFLGRAEDLLRGTAPRPITRSPRSLRRTLAHLLLIMIVFGAAYGAVMGTFGGLHPGRRLQLLYSATKVPMLLAVSFCLTLPSFFVINTIAGLRDDFAEVLHALISTQAGLTIVLASLAPFTAFWYVSVADYDAALTFNALVFAIATAAAQWMLRRSYRPLLARNPRHRHMLRLWLILYAFVAIQMAWVLRPFIGSPAAPVSIFRPEAWGNAYVELGKIVARAMGI